MFAVPLFLLGILAGAIPILLHMMNRQKAPRMEFSTLRFLRVSVQRTRRRKYIHDAALLGLRVLSLVLIAVALATPSISPLNRLLGHPSTAVVIVLDNSWSMGVRHQAGVPWDLARNATEQLLDRLADQDSVALMLTCGPERPEAGQLFQDQEPVRQLLATCSLSPTPSDLASRLRQANQLLATASAANRELYVLTDMQSEAWENIEQDTQLAPDKSVAFIVIDVDGLPLPNLALRSVHVESIAPLAGVAMQAVVELQGDRTATQSGHVELLVDDRPVAVSPTLQVAANGVVSHRLSFAVSLPGVHRGEVRLVDQDACPLDNHLYFAINISPNIPVAVVKPEPSGVPYLDDAFYLHRALIPTRDDSWAVRVTDLTPEDLRTVPLRRFAAVFCVNVPALEPMAADRLREYVAGGGQLLWTGGNRVDVGAYTAMDATAGHELLPLPLAAIREVPPELPDGWHIATVDTGHPAWSGLAEPASMYQSVLVTQHLQFASDPDHTARILARLDDGEPLLVERKVGRGSTLFLGTTVHVDWTNLPLRPVFLPLIARLTLHVAQAQSGAPQILPGAPLLLPSTFGGTLPEVEIIRPTGDVVRLSRSTTESGTPFRYTNTYDVGIYAARTVAADEASEYAVAANLVPAETSPTRITSADFESRFVRNPPLLCHDPQHVVDSVSQLRQGRNLTGFLLILVLVGLVAEAYVANRRIKKEEQPRRPLGPGRYRSTARFLPNHLEPLGKT